MPSVGPELPPHLAKRKRSEEALDTIQDPPKRQRSSSPHPHPTNSRRVIGPAAPPASLSERPATPPTPDTPSSDSDDDDFGPSLPPPPGSINQETERMRQEALAADTAAQEAAKKPQREEWMLLPPKQDDWSARADPTKLKNRKFNTGKGAKAPGRKGSAENALWTETPEQKRQRLADEVMGVKKPAQLGPEDKMDKWKEEEARETGRRIQEYNEKNRNTSLYNEHAKAAPKEKEDDPSKRAFDREKDMGMGVKIGHQQKREMMSKAKDFGTRFEKGRYL